MRENQNIIRRDACHDVSAAQKLAERLPDFIAAARRAGVLVVFVRNVYSTDRNFYLSDSWLEQAARKQSGGYTRFPVCAEGAPRRILSTKSPARR
jgi:nicotinamidase-related amidase